MIHEICVELRTALAAAGCPILVVDGPEHSTSAIVPRERIVVSRNVGDPEALQGPRGTGRNPMHVFDRTVSAKVTIYAQEPRAGALYHEHIRRSDAIADQVLARLVEVLTTRKNAGAQIGPCTIVELVDSKGTSVPNFAVCEIRFFVPRAVLARISWAVAAAETVTLGASSVDSTTAVSMPGSVVTPATSCGA